jgi:amino acid transporter
MVGTVPLAFAVGNGPGVPGAFAFAGLTLLCFSVGYALVARRTGGTGGFYAAVADGLGRPCGVSAGYIALLAYNCATIGLVGAFGYFTSLVLAAHGVHLSWWICAAVGIALTALLGYREIAVSAWTVAILMTGEIAILLALDVGILARDGADALPVASFTPHEVFGSGFGVSVMFAFLSFIGFESAALYGKEAKDPRRSVPRATYVAVVLIAVFYALTSWVAVGAVGAGSVRRTATEQMGDLFFVLGGRYLGDFGATLLQILLCTSLFAALAALHNASNRYAQVLADDGLLPGRLGTRLRTAPATTSGGGTSGSYEPPRRASGAQAALSAVALVVFAVAGLDPYTSMTTSMLGVGTLGIVLLQALAALSVIALCVRGADHGLWQGILAPSLGFAGLAATFWLAVQHFDLLTGTSSGLVAALPWLLVPVAGTGLALGLRQQRTARARSLPTADVTVPESSPEERQAGPIR